MTPLLLRTSLFFGALALALTLAFGPAPALAGPDDIICGKIGSCGSALKKTNSTAPCTGSDCVAQPDTTEPDTDVVEADPEDPVDLDDTNEGDVDVTAQKPKPSAGNIAYSFADLKSSDYISTINDPCMIKDKNSWDSWNKNKKKSKTSSCSGSKIYTWSPSFFSGESIVLGTSRKEKYRTCTWYKTAVPIQRKVVRLFYSLKIKADDDDERGDGTALAFIPGTTTLTTSLCGGYGGYNGYGDSGSYKLPTPRFGLEADTDKSDNSDDPDDANHFSILASGIKHDGTSAASCPKDDSKNSSSVLNGCWTGPEEVSYSMSSQWGGWNKKWDRDKKKGKYKQNEWKVKYAWLEDNYTHQYRAEITACADANGNNICNKASLGNCTASQLYVKAWVCGPKDTNCNTSSSYKDLSSAYSGSASAVIAKCVTFDQTANPSMYFGFTYGNGNDYSTNTYSNFNLLTVENQ